MIEPYYHDGQSLIEIYNEDCREVLPNISFQEGDLILCDPPYGVNYNVNTGGKHKITSYKMVHGDTVKFNPAHLIIDDVDTILWGANHYADELPAKPGWLIWDKREGRMQNNYADAELAWTNCVGTARLFHHEWNGYHRKTERGEHHHPTQKPVTLMRWCIEQAGDVRRVIDPYMGAGPVLRAAKDLGIPAIGIELERDYCDVAIERLSQEVLC